MKKIISIVVAVVVLIFGGIFIAHKHSAPQALVPVTLAAHKIPLAAPYMIAKEKGFFAKNGLDVSIVYFTTGLETIQALTTNQADIAASGGTPFVNVSFQRDDMKIINQISQSNDIQIVARKDAHIATLADLKGKKIGYVKGTVTLPAITDALAGVGLTKKDYTLVEFNQPLPLPNVLFTKEVDAYAAWEPFVTNGIKAVGQDNVVVFGSEHGLHQLLYVTLVRNADLQPKKDVFEKFSKSLVEAEDYMKKNPEESIKTISAVTGMDQNVVTAIWPKFDFTASLNKNLLNELNSQRDMFDSPADIIHPVYEKFIDSEFLKKFAPNSVTL